MLVMPPCKLWAWQSKQHTSSANLLNTHKKESASTSRLLSCEGFLRTLPSEIKEMRRGISTSSNGRISYEDLEAFMMAGEPEGAA